MKIKRLCAANIRDAMRKVREELGSDAVILSNERTSAGFEIVAAVDYDEKLLQGMQQTVATEAAAQRRTLARDSALPEDDKPDLREILREVDPPTSAATVAVAVGETAEAASSGKARVVWSQDPLLVEMRHEIRIMHTLLELSLIHI